LRSRAFEEALMVRDPLSLRREAAQPLYQQVKQFVIDGIRAGEWGDAKRLPSENFLVEQLNVSRMTVHRALRELKSEGVIIRVPGRGTFVSAEKPRSTLLETQDIAEEIASRGAVYRCGVMALDRVRAEKDLAVALGLKAGDAVFHSAIVHEENGIPVQFEERWINPVVAPGYLEQDFTVRTPHRYLVMCAPITEVEHVLHAIRPDRRVREFLRITGDEPCLLLARRTWFGSIAATRSLFVYPGERYSLGGRYKVMGEADRPVLGSRLSGAIYRPNAPGNGSSQVAGDGKRKRTPPRRGS
jgi:GntR family transcriptional regulator, histidine utilization repressor